MKLQNPIISKSCKNFQKFKIWLTLNTYSEKCAWFKMISKTDLSSSECNGTKKDEFYDKFHAS